MFYPALYFILTLLFTDHRIVLSRPGISLGLKNRELCLTEECLAETKFYQSNMDITVDPCEDFYQFTCGNFIKNNSNLSSDVISIDFFTQVKDSVDQDLMGQAKEEVTPSDSATIKKIKTHYQNCINTTRVEEDGFDPVLELLESLGGWPIVLGNKWDENKFDLTHSIQMLRTKNYQLSFPFRLNMVHNTWDPSKSNFGITIPTLTYDEAFLMNDSKLPSAYLNFVKEISVLLGADELKSNEEAMQVQKFESKIYEATLLPDIPRDFTIKELSGNITTIPWLKLFNTILNFSGIHVNEDELVTVVKFSFFARLAELLNETPKRIVANYLGWTIVQDSMPYLPEKLRLIGADFQKIQSHRKEIGSREKVCLKNVKERFNIGISSMYVQKSFSKKFKDDIHDILAVVKAQIEKSLRKIDWWDKETKQQALEKLKSMQANIGYPEELLDDQKVDYYYDELEINPGNALISSLNISIFWLNQTYKSFRTKKDEYSWISMDSSNNVRGIYSPDLNLISITAGLLRGHFYQYSRPKYLNFGAIGTVIGHEIIHAFGTRHWSYYNNGYYSHGTMGSCRESSINALRNKSRCFIDQYNEFVSRDINLKVNGFQTQDENIADNGGTRAAYQAYNEWQLRNGKEPSLPGLDYTPQQMFWVSAASNWCRFIKPEFAWFLHRLDEHSPNAARVIVTFSNIAEFARDFQCKVGSRMNPVKKCIVW